MSDDHENVLPPAVRRQIEQADSIIASMHKKPEDPPQDPPKDPPQDPPKDPPQDPPEKQREDWKHKYSVLKGKYDAEVPRLTSDLRDSRTQLSNVQQQMNDLQAQVAGLKELNKKPAEPEKPLVTQEEIDQFGPDLIDVVERVARQAISPYVDKKFGDLTASVKQVNESVASTQKSVAKSDRDRLYDRLDRDAKGWVAINKDPRFDKWLKEEDGFSGRARGEVLLEAFARNDADRVIKFFKGFQKEHAVENSDPELNAPPADEIPQEESQKGLEDLVAPGTPKTGTTGAQNESGKGRIWTQQDIKALYDAKNEWVKKRPNADLPKEIADAERDLFKAQKENRVRN